MIKLFKLITVLTCSSILFSCANSTNSAADKSSSHSIAKSLGLVSGEKFPTGQKRFRVAETITPEEEYYLGRAVSAKLLAKYKSYDDKNLLDYINQVGMVVVAKSERPETFAGYHFIVLDTEDVNAISAPGGFIFLTRGLLKLLPDEDALASVIGHEVGHVARKHGLAAIKPEHFGDYAEYGSMALSALDCPGCLSQLSVAFQGAVSDIFETLLVSGYSQKQEYEADDAAISNLAGVGYDRHGIVRAFSAVSEKLNSGGWMQSHPDIKDRIESAKRRIAESKSGGSYKIRQARFDAALKSLKNTA